MVVEARVVGVFEGKPVIDTGEEFEKTCPECGLVAAEFMVDHEANCICTVCGYQWYEVSDMPDPREDR